MLFFKDKIFFWSNNFSDFSVSGSLFVWQGFVFIPIYSKNNFNKIINYLKQELKDSKYTPKPYDLSNITLTREQDVKLAFFINKSKCYAIK
jgi:hypothetical protein